MNMITAFIFILTKSGKEHEVMRDLIRDDRIKEIRVVYGDYDIVAKIESNTLNELNKLLINNIRRNTNICGTNTLITV